MIKQVDTNYFGLTSHFEKFILSLKPERTFVSHETMELVANEIIDLLVDEPTEDLPYNLRRVRNSVVRLFDETRDENVDRGRLIDENYIRMSMVTAIIDTLISRVERG